MLVYLALVSDAGDSRPKGGAGVEVFTIQNLSFAYPEQESTRSHDLSCPCRQASFWCCAVHPGCGKSTLLRQLKTVLAPHGTRSGRDPIRGQHRWTSSTSAPEPADRLCPAKSRRIRSSRIRSGTSWRSAWNPWAVIPRPFAAEWPKWHRFSAFRRGFIKP